MADKSRATYNDHSAGTKTSNESKDSGFSTKTRLWTSEDPYRFAPKGKGDCWEACVKKVTNENDEICKAWKEDIDTHMVFAGLFSAAVTAFTVESFKWLQHDNEKNTVRLLLQISQQLSTSSGNASAIPFVPDLKDSPSDPSVVRINVFWFLSLTISLSSVLIGILCKQWLLEHRGVVYTRSHEETLALSQLRDESLRKWGIPTILSSLPLMLQVALMLFFAGVLDLLWSLNTVIAGIVSSVMSITLLFLLFTTLAPAYYLHAIAMSRTPQLKFGSKHPCAYKSPQSWLAYRLSQFVIERLTRRNAVFYRDWNRSDLYVLRYDEGAYRCRVADVLKWISRSFTDNIETAIHIFHCLQDLPIEDTAWALGWTWTPDRDRINFEFFRNLRCGWNESVSRFMGELCLRRRSAGDIDAVQPTDISYIANAGLIACSESQGVKEEVCEQIIHYIHDCLHNPSIPSQEIAQALLSMSRSLWYHQDHLIRERSRPLLRDFSQWLMSSPYQESNVFHIVGECACIAISILEDDPVHQEWPDIADFVRAIDHAVQLNKLDVDSIFNARHISWTWDKAMAQLLNTQNSAKK